MANLKITLRKKGASSFEGGDKLLPETDWAYILNKPPTFVPDPHEHSIEEITGLRGELDGQITQAWVTANTRSKTWVPLWSEVTGLVDQLDDKENAITKGTTAQYFRGDMSLATFPTIPTIPSLMTQADITNTTATRRTINASVLNANFYNKESIDLALSGKQNSLGFTPVTNARTIAGLDLTANRTRDAILGVSTNGYYRRTGANTYDIRTVANLKSDLGLGTLAYSNGQALNDLTNVTFDGTPSAGQILTYGSGVWTNVNKPTYNYSEINNKPNVIIEGDERLTNSRPASDVHGWAKNQNKPDYTLDEIYDGTNHKRVTQNQIDGWNSKQNALNFTPENAANKRTNIRTSGADNASYVTELGVKTYVDGQIGSVYRPSGDWNASTNSPALANNTPANKGKVYRVSTAGTRFGFTFAVGDKLAFNESGVISKWDNVDDVTSVNGKVGTVVINADDIGDGTTYKRVSQSEKNTWDGKQSAITGAATTIASSNLTANRALISNGSGKVAVSGVTSTQLGFLLGSESNIQSQINGKAPLGHNHNILDFANLESDLGLSGLRANQYSDSSSPDGDQWHHALRLQHGGYAANGYYREILLPFGSDRAFISRVNNSTTKHTVELATQPWVTSNTRSNVWTPTWSEVSDKPIITVGGTGLGNDATPKAVSEKILKLAIEQVSPSGSRPASDVHAWAKAENKPSYNLDEISTGSTYIRVTQSQINSWNNKQNALNFTPENAANKRTNIRTSGADNASYVTELGVKTYVDGVSSGLQTQLNGKQDALSIMQVQEGINGSLTTARSINAANLRGIIEDYIENIPYESLPLGTSRTSSFTFVIGDANRFIRCSGGAINATVPPNSSVAFPIGTEIYLYRESTGAVTIAAGSGVTLQSVDNKKTISKQYQTITIKKLAVNTWTIVGAL